MAIRRVASLLLCIYASEGVGLGLLKAKVRNRGHLYLSSDDI